MTEEYVYINITGQDGEVYEVHPTDGLLRFLRRLAEGEASEQNSQVRVSQNNEAELSYAYQS